jgi:hypothetical protein
MDRWTLKLCLINWGCLFPGPCEEVLRQVMVRAARSFRPTPYEGGRGVFRTSAHLGAQLGLPGWWSDLCLGFKELCRRRFAVTFINATHNGVVSVIREPPKSFGSHLEWTREIDEEKGVGRHKGREFDAARSRSDSRHSTGGKRGRGTLTLSRHTKCPHTITIHAVRIVTSKKRKAEQMFVSKYRNEHRVSPK